MKKILFVLFIFLFFPIITLADNYTIESYIIDVDVLENGDAEVSEIVLINGSLDYYTMNLYYENNTSFLRASGISNMQDYDVILLGYPIWWHTEPMIINTFLESYDLNEKLVIPFCTSGGSDISESIPDLTAIVNARGARVGTGLTANNVDDAAIRSWLSENGIVF